MAELTCVEHSPEFKKLRQTVHDSISKKLKASRLNFSENLRAYFKVSAGVNEFFRWFDSIDETNKSSEQCFEELLAHLRDRVASWRRMCRETPGDGGDAIELMSMEWGLQAIEQIADNSAAPSLSTYRLTKRRQPDHMVQKLLQKVGNRLSHHARELTSQLIAREIQDAWNTDKPVYHRIQNSLKSIDQNLLEIFQVLEPVSERSLTKAKCLKGFEEILTRRIESLSQQQQDPQNPPLPENVVIIKAMELTRSDLKSPRLKHVFH